ncbi:MAG: hypothetical protein ACREGG_04880 [Candidatus Saccharimonadales bacterium]
MEHTPGPESIPTLGPDTNLGEALDPSFCLDVLGREMTPAEIDERNYNFRVEDLDKVIDTLRKYPDWEISELHETPYTRIVVTMRLKHAKGQFNFLCFHQFKD